MELSLSSAVIETIDVNHVCVKDKCYEMFNTWLKQTCDPCWCQVANAFKTVNLHEAAKEIETKFGGLLTTMIMPVSYVAIYCFGI